MLAVAKTVLLEAVLVPSAWWYLISHCKYVNMEWGISDQCSIDPCIELTIYQ